MQRSVISGDDMNELEKHEEAPHSEYTPRPLSLRQNVLLTLKVLALVAILVAVLWLGSEALNP